MKTSNQNSTDASASVEVQTKELSDETPLKTQHCSSKKSKVTRQPKARLYQADNDWFLQLALPGVKDSAVEIEEQGGKLTIRAESPRTKYSRSFILPHQNEFSEINATLREGLLTITLTTVQPTVRTININSAG